MSHARVATAKVATFQAVLRPGVEFDRMEAILWPLIIHTGLALQEDPAISPPATEGKGSRISFGGGQVRCRIETEDWRALAPVFWECAHAVRKVSMGTFDAGLVDSQRIAIVQPQPEFVGDGRRAGPALDEHDTLDEEAEPSLAQRG